MKSPQPSVQWTRTITPCTDQVPYGIEDFDPIPHPDHPSSRLLFEWLNTLEVKPISAVKWRCLGGWYTYNETKENDVFYFIKGGPGWFSSLPARKHQLVDSGTGIFVPPGVEFNVRPYQGRNVTVYSIHFFATVLRSVNLLKLLDFPHLMADTPGGKMESLCESMCREYACREPGWDLSMQSGISQLLLHAMRYSALPLKSDPDLRSMDRLRIIYPALDYIENHLDRYDLQIADLADHLGMSEGHFRRVFRKIMDFTPVQWIQKRRIDLACVYLKRNELSIQEIAERCGFRTYTFFFRTFGKWTEQTPAQFRKSARL